MPRPSRLLKIGVLLLAGLLISAIGTAATVVSLRDRRWAAMNARVDALIAGLDAPPLPRVPLGREILPGNAWDDYLSVPSDAGKESARIAVNHLFYGGDPPDQVQELIRAHATEMEVIRKAARRQSCKLPPAPLVDGYPMILDERYSGVHTGVTLCVAQARFLADAGKPAEALDLLLDVYLVGRDLAGTRTGINGGDGIKVMEAALDEYGDILKRRKLDEVLLQETVRRLKLLDEHGPGTSAMMLDSLAWLGHGLRTGLLKSDDLGPTWRYLFSARLQAATLFARADDTIRQAIALLDRPWPEAAPIVNHVDREAYGSDTYDQISVRKVVYAQVRRRIRTTLRMILIAAQYRATGEIPTLDSDYGGKIRTKLTSDRLLIWAHTDTDSAEPPPLEDFERYSLSLVLSAPIRK